MNRQVDVVKVNIAVLMLLYTSRVLYELCDLFLILHLLILHLFVTAITVFSVVRSRSTVVATSCDPLIDRTGFLSTVDFQIESCVCPQQFLWNVVLEQSFVERSFD